MFKGTELIAPLTTLSYTMFVTLITLLVQLKINSATMCSRIKQQAQDQLVRGVHFLNIQVRILVKVEWEKQL